MGKISGRHSESYCFSKWHKNVFLRIGPNGESIVTPSVCLYMTWSKMKNDSYAHKVKSFFMPLRSKLWIVLVSQNKSSMQMSITTFKATLVNNLSTPRLAMRWSRQKLETSSANENKSCTENSLDVRGEKIGTRCSNRWQNRTKFGAVSNSWFGILDFHTKYLV